MFGSHLSIAGGLVNALHRARELRLDCVQIFTNNQRQWRSRPIDEHARLAWLHERARMQWRKGAVVSHNSYLINLASPDRAMRERSIAAQRNEMLRCESLDIALVVAHPGAHLRPSVTARRPGDAPSRCERAGLMRIARALDRLHRDLRGLNVITCLETTAGSGTNLGFDFMHLAIIRDAVAEPDRIGFCFDTCHVTAAGYDMSTDARAADVLELWDSACGFDALRVFHLNDSVGAVGSRIDRHAHIGRGTCGLSCFRAIVNHPRFRGVPKILETPKGVDERGTAWDVHNIRRLKRLIRPVESSR